MISPGVSYFFYFLVQVLVTNDFTTASVAELWSSAVLNDIFDSKKNKRVNVILIEYGHPLLIVYLASSDQPKFSRPQTKKEMWLAT